MILAAGERVCPLFQVPWASASILKLDWLHVVDLGICADFVGGLLWYLITHNKVTGPNQKERCRTLHKMLMEYYEKQPPEAKTSRLSTLSMGIIKTKKQKIPKTKDLEG